MPKRQHGKRWCKDADGLPDSPVGVAEAIEKIRGFAKTKFDQTVELVCHLGIDPKQADQAIRGSVSLPHGIGANKRVIAFCEGEDVAAAEAAGAIEVGSDELVKKIQDGWMDFDVAIAAPSMMRTVSRLGRILGPQGKMPSPKSGTVTAEVGQAVAEYVAGKLEYRSDAGGNVAVPVGKLSFEAAKLAENVEAFLDRLRRLKPAAAKGTYFKKVVLTGTMTPAIVMDVR